VLAECPYFRLELHQAERETAGGPFPSPAWVVFPSGEGTIHGLPWKQGDVWLLETGESARISGRDLHFLTGHVPR